MAWTRCICKTKNTGNDSLYALDLLKNTMSTVLLIGVLLCYPNLASAFDVELRATSPKSPAVLNLDEALYVLIHYQSEEPLRFQAIGTYHGAEIKAKARMNPSQAYPLGEGQAIAWVAYYEGTKIDAVKITVYNANWRLLDSKSLSLSAGWEENQDNSPNPKEPWVNKLNQQQQHHASMAGRQQPLPPSSVLFIQLLFFAIPVYWILQITLLLKWTGRWRNIACLPLFVSIPLLGYTLFALYAGSNLWPLMMLFITPAVLVALIVIMIIKKVSSNEL